MKYPKIACRVELKLSNNLVFNKDITVESEQKKEEWIENLSYLTSKQYPNDKIISIKIIYPSKIPFLTWNKHFVKTISRL